MITSSCSSDTSHAARIACSSSERFISAEDREALVLAQNSREWRRLPKAIGPFTVVEKERDHLAGGAVPQDMAPLHVCGLRSPLALPSIQVFERAGDQSGVRAQLLRHSRIKGAAALVYPVVKPLTCARAFDRHPYLPNEMSRRR